MNDSARRGALPGLALALLSSAMVAACIGGAAAPLEPIAPDARVLREAQTRLAKAEAAGAATFAPRVLREARRRLSTAQALLYRAAADGRGLSGAERVRVERLAAEAALDARLALTRTQAHAIERKLEELRSRLQPNPQPDGGRSSS